MIVFVDRVYRIALVVARQGCAGQIRRSQVFVQYDVSLRISLHLLRVQVIAGEKVRDLVSVFEIERIAGLDVGLVAVLRDRLRGDVLVIFTVGILDPVDDGVLRRARCPIRLVVDVVVGNDTAGKLVSLRIGECVRVTQQSALLVHKIAVFICKHPTLKYIALSGGFGDVVVGLVFGVDRLHAVAAVEVEVDQIIIAGVIQLKLRGTVRGDKVRLMIQLGKALKGDRTQLVRKGAGQTRFFVV